MQLERQISDFDLWKSLKSGDDSAYSYLFKNYYPAMCVAAYSYVQDTYTSEALVDDVIYNIWESRNKLDLRSSLKAYLLQCVKNKCLEYLRSASVAKRNPLSDYNEKRALDHNRNSTEDRLFGDELYELLEKALEELPDETRKVFEYSRIYDYSYADIANELGISVNTVKYHMKKALSIFRMKFSEYIVFLLFFLLP